MSPLWLPKAQVITPSGRLAFMDPEGSKAIDQTVTNESSLHVLHMHSRVGSAGTIAFSYFHAFVMRLR